MFTIIVFILILGFLVFVHEIGHFLVARRNGIKAEEFGLGFPPRAIGVVKNEKGKWDVVKGSIEVESKNTVYSLNWIPIGGFVRIKGENGEGIHDKDSFVNKSAWVRTKVLAAGVIMNMIFAWVLFSFAFMIGVPQEANENVSGAQILIQNVEVGSPAEKMGLKGGDVVAPEQTVDGKMVSVQSITDLQNLISGKKNESLTLSVMRGKSQLQLTGVPNDVDGKGKLGIALASVYTKKYSFFGAFKEGFIEVGNVFAMLGVLFQQLFSGNTSGIEVMGPVKIAQFTGNVIPLGFAYILRFAAILSVNLAIFNALPLPALDGGRIFFIMIGKLKGSPVSQKIEQPTHSIGMIILLLLMLIVTIREIFTPQVIDRIRGIF